MEPGNVDPVAVTGYTPMGEVVYTMESKVADEVWGKVVAHVKTRVNDGTLAMFVAMAHPAGIDDDTLSIAAMNEFSRSMLEQKFLLLVREALAQIGHPSKVRVILTPRPPTARPSQPLLLEGEPIPAALAPVPTRKTGPARIDGMFNPKYTFETFVVGKSNEFAHAVCQAVARSPGDKYNPVFIYGGVGLGKTHLMQAIGHEVRRLHPQAKIAYLSSETFANDFISATREKTWNDFRLKYRRRDLILIDDVQFFAGKERVVEEFFHTFNDLFQNKKQIVMTSDSPPKKIQNLEERLVSRFEQGVVVDIQPPDVVLRAAILQKAAAGHGIQVPTDIILYLAELVTKNIRVLEGAFNNLVAYSSVSGRPIDRELVEAVLKDIVREGDGNRLTIPWIQRRVAEFYQIAETEMQSDRRSQVVTVPRQVAMYLARQLMHETYPKIGEAFGGKDHSTVMHAEKRIARRLEQDPAFKSEIEQLIRLIRPTEGT